MLSKESFVKGIKDMRAVFGISPDKETLEIWFRHLSKLDDKYFLAGVSLLADNEEAFYPNTNIVFKIKDYAKKAREREIALLEKVKKEDWQLEVEKALNEEQRKYEEKRRILYSQPPDNPRFLKYVKKLFLEADNGQENNRQDDY